MSAKNTNGQGSADLRRRAEGVVGADAAKTNEALSHEEGVRLLHELRVHQIELETQNEELRRTQEELEASRARYFDLYDLAPVGYVTLSEHSLILEANLAASTLLGLPKSLLNKSPLTRHILPEDEDIYYLHRKQLLKTGAPQVCELRMLRKDTGPFWARLEAKVAVDGESGMAVCHMVVSDITDRKRAEEALWKSERENRELLETANSIIIRWDKEGIIRFINDYGLRFFGYSAEELLGRDIKTIVPKVESTGRDLAALDRDILKNPEKYMNVTNENIGKDGKTVWISWTNKAILDGQGNVREILAIGNDITAMKEAEALIRENQARLEESNKALEDFSHSISHDLRAPLRAINGYARMVVDEYGPALKEDGQRKLAAIATNALKMGQLIDDLLAFSRAGRKAVDGRGIDMNSLAAEVVATLKASIAGDVNPEIDVGSLPAAHGDPALIRQVLVNLLENAAKFSRNRPDARIEVGSIERDGEQTYFVKDNGIGFDMKYSNKLFGVFQRLVTEKEFEGTGVGLAIVHRIITRHGGRVWAEGKVNAGGSFYFTLPGKDHRSSQRTIEPLDLAIRKS